MKATGIIRKVDMLGRIVLPVELRVTMDLQVNGSVEFYVEGNSIILKKYEPECVFCGDAKDAAAFRGRNVCGECRRELKG